MSVKEVVRDLRCSCEPLGRDEMVLKLLLILDDFNPGGSDGSSQIPLLIASIHVLREILALGEKSACIPSLDARATCALIS